MMFIQTIMFFDDIVEFANNLDQTLPFAVLNLYVRDEPLRDWYQGQIIKHNAAMLNETFPNSGFDVCFPNDVVFDTPFESKMVNLGIKTEMVYCEPRENGYRMTSSAYLVHPRSSISKTPLMLANHTGIIDSGYRGFLIGAFRLLTGDEPPYVVEAQTRMLQICHPTLCPIFVRIVENESHLSETSRGEGGFGSTGK